MIRTETRGVIAVVALEHGKANALDVELSMAIRDELAALRGRAGAIVLTGRGSIFSAGVDLFKVIDGAGEYLDRFLPLLSAMLLDIFTWPRPIVAAINGHAIAGGCIAAAACDYRLMAEGPGRIGVPELSVGVPFPTAPLEILRATFAPHVLQELIYVGRTWPAADAHARGVVHEVAGADQMLDRACEVAERLAAVPQASFELTKRMLRRPTLDRIRRLAPTADGDVVAAWRRPETLAAIRAHIQKVIRDK